MFEESILDIVDLLIAMHGIGFIAMSLLGIVIYIQKRRLLGIRRRVDNLENQIYNILATKKEFRYED